MEKLNIEIDNILSAYSKSFSNKVYSAENNDVDILMKTFNISAELKRENKQYWGRELGMVWQKIVIEIFKNQNKNYSPAIKFDGDEPCDLFVGKDAIDTKYRVGSGDSGTLKKFKQYGKLLNSKGYRPVFLIVRNDNLSAAMTACKTGGWDVLTGKNTFEYIKSNAGIDIEKYLKKYENKYYIKR